MNYYRYKLITPSGEISSGIVKLPYQDVVSAISHLERNGSIAVFVKKLGAVSTFIMKLGSFRLKKKMSRPDQAELFNNISLMLRSGIPLSTALEESGGSLESSEVSDDINDMILKIQDGASFSEAAARYPYIFPNTVLYLIRIGEETGQLDHMLKDASEHLKRVQTIASDTKQALLYPTFVLTTIAAGFIFWFYYVVPKIMTLFKEMDVTLPGLTLFVMNVSYFVQDHFLSITAGTVLSVFAVFAARRKSLFFRKQTDALIIKLPITRTIMTASILAFISEYFSLLIKSGIDILQAISIMKESIRNEVYREKLQEVNNGLTRGLGIAESFKEAVIFPALVTRMITIGETSGTLSVQLDYLAEEYRNKLAITVATIGKMIEPLVLVIAGAMFAVIIAGLFLPIYDLVSQVSG